VRPEVDASLVTKAFFSYYLITSLGWLGSGGGDPQDGWDSSQAGISPEGLQALVEEAGVYLDLIFQGIGTMEGDPT
jgi:hypothetical protein